MNGNTQEGGYYSDLQDFFHDAHQLILSHDEIQDVIRAVNKFQNKRLQAEVNDRLERDVKIPKEDLDYFNNDQQ